MNTTLKRLARSLFIPTLALALSAPVHADVLLDKIVAVVNDRVILSSELNERMAEKAQELQGQNITVDDRMALQEKVLESLIFETLQLERAKQVGLNTTDEEVNTQMQQIAEQNKLTLMELRNRLNAQMPDGFAQVRQKVQHKILIQKLREAEVISQTQVTESEIQNYLQRQSLALSDLELQLSHILIALPESATPQQRSEALTTIEALRNRIVAGEDFSQIAVRHSNGSKALEGGNLGWLKQEQIPTFFADAIQNLNVGQISQVIQSPSGFHLIKLADKRDLNAQLVKEYRLHRFIILSDNASMDKVPAQLLELSKSLNSVKAFNELNTLFADIPKEVNAGSDLGWRTLEQIPSGIRDMVSSLAPNTALPPLATEEGWMILFLEDAREINQQDVDKTQQAIQAIRIRKANETFDLWLRRLKDEAYIKTFLN
ncbi:peptidylprolyl isomerase [Thiomicrorhabdus aquaedulcis]|uniref:peptidylprolyl isomerase n=1 Tax=Thiomicrorhabdus aquaedulcis TaxID=2211106 RepID=UPI000FD852C1|nr:peptidylprolyl isomerase [Thiomicrorhabdus aquaedulcis]